MDMYEARRIDRWDAIRKVRTPLVAAVSGYCLGGGNELAMACDLIVASETARFGQPETGLGIIPGAGGTQRLTRAIGKAKAMDVILSGRFLDADEAERAGLVARVVAKEAWLEEAKSVAARDRREGPDRPAPRQGVGQPRVRLDARDRPRLRAQGALPRVRVRGRSRGPDGVHREAQAGIPRPLRRVRPSMTMPSRWHDPPRLRTLDDEDERHATWLELFFDLVFVVAVAQLADGLAADPSVHGFLVFAGLFVPVWWAWVGYTFYADRFDTDDPPTPDPDDRRHVRGGGARLGVPDAFHGETAAFALAYAGVRAIVVILNARAWWHLPASRPLLNVYIPAFTASVLLFVLSGGCRAAGSLLALGYRAGRRSRHAAREPGPDQAGSDPRLPYPGACRPLHDHRLRGEHARRGRGDDQRELEARVRSRRGARLCGRGSALVALLRLRRLLDRQADDHRRPDLPLRAPAAADRPRRARRRREARDQGHPGERPDGRGLVDHRRRRRAVHGRGGRAPPCHDAVPLGHRCLAAARDRPSCPGPRGGRGGDRDRAGRLPSSSPRWRPRSSWSSLSTTGTMPRSPAGSRSASP